MRKLPGSSGLKKKDRKTVFSDKMPTSLFYHTGYSQAKIIISLLLADSTLHHYHLLKSSDWTFTLSQKKAVTSAILLVLFLRQDTLD